MPNYEVMYLFFPKISEKEAKAEIKKTNQIIKQLGGKIEKEEYWGLRELSYPIQHHKQGYYHVVWFKFKKDQVLKLNQKLKSINKLLRFLITQAEPKKLIPLEKQKTETEKEQREIRTTKIKPLKRKKATVPEKKESQIKEEKTEKKIPKTNKSDLKDLDDKLDEILKEEVL